MSTFEKLNGIDVSAKTEKKNGLTYLSWAWAWGELKKVCPDAKYTVYENKDGWNYFTDGRTAWVKTGVEVDGIEYIEYLPIMDFKNKSLPLENITSFDVNKAIQRSLTKAVARHGLGLYIYAGEDLPECQTEDKPSEKKPAEKPSEEKPETEQTENEDGEKYYCSVCEKEMPKKWYEQSIEKYGRAYCTVECKEKGMKERETK